MEGRAVEVGPSSDGRRAVPLEGAQMNAEKSSGTKKPTPQISPQHCGGCGQLIGSTHCECDKASKLDPHVGRNALARHVGGDL